MILDFLAPRTLFWWHLFARWCEMHWPSPKSPKLAGGVLCHVTHFQRGRLRDRQPFAGVVAGCCRAGSRRRHFGIAHDQPTAGLGPLVQLRKLRRGYEQVSLATVPAQVRQALASLPLAAGRVCAVPCGLVASAVVVSVRVPVPMAVAVTVAVAAAACRFAVVVSTGLHDAFHLRVSQVHLERARGAVFSARLNVRAAALFDLHRGVLNAVLLGNAQGVRERFTRLVSNQMHCHRRDLRAESPHVQVMNIGDARNVLQSVQQQRHVHMLRSAIHKDTHAGAQNVDCGKQHQHREQERADGVSQVPFWLHPNHHRRDHDAHRLDQIAHNCKMTTCEGVWVAGCCVAARTVDERGVHGDVPAAALGAPVRVPVALSVRVPTVMGMSTAMRVSVAQHRQHEDVDGEASGCSAKHDGAVHGLRVQHTLHRFVHQRS